MITNLSLNIMDKVLELVLANLMLVTIIFNANESGVVVMEWIFHVKNV